MPTPLNVNGVIYNYPVNFDTTWGVDATGWAQAVTSGMLQKAGGSFPLTADVDFGSSFGLKSSYFETRSVNPATSGTVRLSSADAGMAFRNNANSGNLILTTDASDNLLYNGHVISPSSAGPVTSVTGTAHEVIVSSPTGNITLSLPQAIDTSSNPAFSTVTVANGMTIQSGSALALFNNTNTNRVFLAVPSSLTNYNLLLPPNPGSNGQVLQTDGTGTTTWVNAAGGGTVNSATQFQIAYYAATGNTISGDSSIVTNASNQLLVVDGGMSTPSYSFISDPDTGMFLLSPETIQVVIGGTPIIGVTAAEVDFATTVDLNSSKIINLANGTASTDAAAFGQIVGSFVAPTVQRLTLSSGTYTTPTSPRSPLYLKVRMVGGGGGGSGGGTVGGGAGNGTNGTATTFGSLIAGLGAGGTAAGSGGAGGGNTTGSTTVYNIQGGSGASFWQESVNLALQAAGGFGGASVLGGGARGGTPSSAAAGQNGTGEGGQGGGIVQGAATSADLGSGGGAGGYLEIIITSPAATYSYGVGQGGNGGSAGSAGSSGGNGASGSIVVEEYYQ